MFAKFVVCDYYLHSKLLMCLFRALAVGSEDATTRVFATPKSGKLSVNTLGGHKDEVIGKRF